MRSESRLEPARAEDGAALLELIESAPAAGDLSILYTRRPDPVASILGEGPGAELRVIRDGDGVPAFMESCVERRVFLGGQAHTLAYVGNIRKRPGSLGQVNWLKQVCELETGCHTAALCSILGENRDVERLLCGKKRPYLPTLRRVCDYRTLLLSPRALQGGADGAVFRLREEDRGELLDFLDREGRRWDLFPAVRELEREFYGLAVEDFWGLRQNGRLCACGALWDQRSFRQYIVKEYRGPYRLAARFPQIVSKIGYISLPKAGETADVRVLTLLCTRGGDGGLLGRLLAGLARAAQAQGCGALVLGLCDNDRKSLALQGVRAISFSSAIYAMETPENSTPLPGGGGELSLEVGWL